MAKKRSPAHPAIGLKGSVDRVRKIAGGFHDHWFPIDALAELFKLSPKSSGFLQMIGALKQFGLIAEKGSKDDREFQLTAIALDMAHCEEGSAEYKEALTTSALLPALHSEIWEKYGGKLPPEDAPIRAYLVRQRIEGTFNPAYVDGFINQFRDTLRFACIDHEDTISGDDQGNKTRTLKAGDFVRHPSQGADQFRVLNINGEWVEVEGSDMGGWLPMSELTVVDSPMQNDRQTSPPVAPGLRPLESDSLAPEIAQEETALDEGSAVLRMPTELSPESVEELGYWLTGILQKARRRAGLPKIDDPAGGE